MKELLKEIEKSRDRICKERDRLRGLIDDAECLLAGCIDAGEHLRDAIDILSEYA